MKFKLGKILVITIIIIISLFSNFTFATFNIKQADLYSKGRCKTLLKLKSNGGDIIVTKVFYKYNEKENPAYCINVELGGVGEYGNYSVTIDSAVSNPAVWRAITNGYPYKSLETLGVKDEDEAYTATKQAVYCVLYNYDVSRYEAVGEAGERTLNALKQIVKAAREGTNTKPSNKITIEETSDWEIDSEYISKKFKIVTECNSKEFKISLTEGKQNQQDKNETSDKIKIYDLQGNEISTTTSNEFKVMIPIRLLEKEGSFNINVKAELETYPVLYGNSNNSSRQNYAIAGEIYEGGEGSLKVNYSQNTNKLTIVKVGETDDEKLEGVEFNILNEAGEVQYSNLQTNESGEIILQGIFPGKYYLEEVNTISGYRKLENKIEFVIKLNEQLKIKVENQKEELTQNTTILKNEMSYKEELVPKKSEIKTESSYSEKITRLPVTGM